jgi:hypothetical protein
MGFSDSRREIGVDLHNIRFSLFALVRIVTLKLSQM